LLSGHARRSREGGGDTTLASQLSGDMRESGQPPPPESAPLNGRHHPARMTLSSGMSRERGVSACRGAPSLVRSGRDGVSEQHHNRSTRASNASLALTHSADDTTSGRAI